MSHQANTHALASLAQLPPQDVVLAEWSNHTFRPCHFLAVDRRHQCLVLGVRGSLELSDLTTDLTAAPVPFEYKGLQGWVHEGLLSAAIYVHSNTAQALAEAAQEYPGWPLLVTGEGWEGGGQ